MIVRLLLTMTLGNWSREAERHGYMLDWTFDQENNDCAYVCTKMTPGEWKQSVEWEKEE